MEWVEVTGRTVAEAKESALAQLGITEGDAEIVVLSEPRTGLFGRLREEARVRARVRPVSPRPKRTRRSRGRRAGESSGAGSRETSSNGAGRSESGPSTGTPRSRRSRGRGRQGTGGGDRPPGTTVEKRETPAPAAADEAAPGEGTEVAHEIPLEDQGAAAQDFLEGLLRAFDFEATVETRLVDEDTVEVAADGEDLGLLVGPKGATLAALQEVTRTAVQRQFPTRTDRILVDVAQYRQRRAAALQRFTRQVAEEVLSSGEERVLEPMSPADRKVVHDTVNELEGVVTRSEGEEPSRFVVIAPAD